MRSHHPTVEGDVVNGRPAGVVVREQVLDAAVAQPRRVEALEARPPSPPLSAEGLLVAEPLMEQLAAQLQSAPKGKGKSKGTRYLTTPYSNEDCRRRGNWVLSLIHI